MTGADLATAFDVRTLADEVRALRAELAAVAERLPSTWLSLGEAAERLGVDGRTVSAMIRRGELVGRKAGRRVLVDSASLRPRTNAEIARLVQEARG